MLCPRCGAPLKEAACPRCSRDRGADAGRSRGGPLQFEARSQSTAGQQETAARWQQELKRRMASRQAEAVQDRAVDRSEPIEAAAPGAAPELRATFEYEMNASTATPFPRPVEDAGLADKPLVRAPRRVRRSDPDSAQRVLDLDASPPSATTEFPQDSSEPGAAVVDREILFSRFLCGIIDLSLPILIGFLFTIAGSWILNFDYFLSAALEWAVAFSLFFFFFNSFFFLLLMGQTPGMYFTELRLVSHEGGGATLGQVAVRVLLFLPSALSLIGLVWSLRDRHCRTAHDLWSGTRVEVLG